MSSPVEVCEDDNVNILENRNLYIHQYLTAIFQINLKKTSETGSLEDKVKIPCLNLPEEVEVVTHLSLTNYSHYVFENLMNPKCDKVPVYIEKRFFSERGNLFSNTYRVYEDDLNRVAYLFNCYCRVDYVKDFANFISAQEQKKLKRYIIDQVALLLVLPYVNQRYRENSNESPFVDLFHVLTQNIPWPSEYLTFVKKFFVEVTDAIYNAKNGIAEVDDDYTSSLSDLSSDELNIELIVKQLYDLLRKKFKEAHFLSAPFVDDIKFINILIASPMLAEIFIDLNSPKVLRNGATNNTGSSETNAANTNNAPRIAAAGGSNEIIQSIFMNTLSSLEFPGSNLQAADSTAGMEKFFHESLLGILLCNSPLPSQYSKTKEPANFFLSVFQGTDYEYSFFTNPTSKSPSEIERTELEIDDNLAKLRSNLTDLFFSLLKSSSSVRTKTLKWIECCLATFNNRAKLWTNELMALVGGNNNSNISDGFVLNFSAVLLNLCKPFCSIPENISSYGGMLDGSSMIVNQKMLKVDPIYVGYTKKLPKNVQPESDYRPYLDILNQESVLINPDSNRNISSAENSMSTAEDSKDIELVGYQPNFITRCFFATHKALHLGFRVIHERFNTINQENSQIQRRLDSSGATSALQFMNRDNLTPSQQETITRLDQNMTITLSMKSALIETSFINLLLEFYLATATWINNLAVCESEAEAAQSFKNLQMILSGDKPDSLAKSQSSMCLKWIPEFLIENIIDFMLFLRYFEVKPKILTIKSDLESFLTLIVLFMGSQNRMRNPHLRAKMAEMLEALLPTVQVNIQP